MIRKYSNLIYNNTCIKYKGNPRLTGFNKENAKNLGKSIFISEHGLYLPRYIFSGMFNSFDSLFIVRIFEFPKIVIKLRIHLFIVDEKNYSVAKDFKFRKKT